MIDEIINSILEAESAADDIVKESSARAREMVAAAEKRAAETGEEAKKNAKASRDEVMNNAQYVAKRQRDNILADGDKASEELEKLAAANEDKAVALILERLKVRYGN